MEEHRPYGGGVCRGRVRGMEEHSHRDALFVPEEEGEEESLINIFTLPFREILPVSSIPQGG